MNKPKAMIIYNDSLYHKGSSKSAFWAERLSKDGFDVERVGNTDPLCDRNLLSKLDLLVISWSEDHIIPSQAINLLNAVGFDGLGFAGYHETATAFRQYQWHFMLGSFMATHPGLSAEHWQHTYRVHITKPDDPIMRGITDFDHHSEQFYLLHDGDNLNEIIADTKIVQSDFPWVVGLSSPVAYKRRWGAGRIFYSSLGHFTEEFDLENPYKIMHRGMLWASKRLPDGMALEIVD